MADQPSSRLLAVFKRLCSSTPLAGILLIDLRRLIVGLAVLAVLITFGNTFYAGYTLQRDLLIRNTLQNNEAYARKVADMADGFIQQALTQLGYSAELLAQDFDDRGLRSGEIQRLHQQTESFNSLLLVNARGQLLASAPELPVEIGTELISAGIVSAARSRSARVSEPFVTARTQRLVILISQPIINAQDQLLGFIGGTVYLQELNGLHRVLGQNTYLNGSYLFVVDRQGNLVFHRDPARVGANVRDNPAVKRALAGETASAEVRNMQGVAMLAGFAPIATTGWGLVVQRPMELSLSLLGDQMLGMLLHVAPMLLLTLLGVWVLARFIAYPLHDLALIASRLDEVETPERIRAVPSWYYEAIKLKQAILAGLTLVQRKITRLNQETITDALTGLLNRRGMTETLQAWVRQHRRFAVVVIDIDHFKPINDSHGHDVGDTVLRYLADRMRRNARGGDVLCRNGGDEFTMLLTAVSPEEARLVCERLAASVVQGRPHPGGAITLSMGVAGYDGSESIEDVLKSADVALYQAKQRGRNQIAVAGPLRPG